MNRPSVRQHYALLIGIGIILATGFALTFPIRRAAEREVEVQLRHVAEEASASTDIDRLQDLLSRPLRDDDPDYVRLHESYRRMGEIFAEEHSVRWIYIVHVTGREAVFALDSVPPEDPGDSPPGTPYLEPPEAVFQAAEDGMTRFTGPYTDEYGSYYSVFGPIRRTDGRIVAVVGADIETTAFEAIVSRHARIMYALLAAVLALFIIGYVALLRRLKRERVLITEKKTAEKRVIALETENRSVTEGLLAGLYILQDGVFKYVNPAFINLFGYQDAKDILGRPWQEFVTDRGREQVEASGLAMRMTGKGKTMRYVFEAKRPDGSTFFTETLSNPAAFEGKPAVIGSMVDVTDRMKAEAKAAELEVLKHQFITVVSHQLRTPLSAVRWNLESLLNEDMGRLKDGQRQFLRITYAANGEVIRRINDFLLALDIEEGRVTTTTGAISMESLTRSVMTDVLRRCELKGLSCAFEPPPVAIPTVEADADKIRAAMEKLADNALLYTEKGSITISLATAGEKIRFSVADTGIGIPKAEQPRVYERFYRASNALRSETDASGLGLYIAKYFIDQHRGKLGFTSKEGEGSTFWFELPIS